MAKKMGNLDTEKMYAQMFGGTVAEPEKAEPKQAKAPAQKTKPARFPPSNEATRITIGANQKMTRAVAQPYRYDSSKPDEIVKRSYFMTGDLILALEERSIREKRKGGSGELSSIVRDALREYLADELRDTAQFWD